MARTRSRNPPVPLAHVKPFRQPGASPVPFSFKPPTFFASSERSLQLLFSLPHFIVAEIFAFVLADGLFRQANETPFFAYVSLFTLVTESKALRGVCREWSRQLRDCLFAGLSARSGLLALVTLMELPRIRAVFPMLNHCVLDLGDMMDVAEMEGRLSQLQSNSSELAVVRAVTWGDDSFEHLNFIPYGSPRTSRSRTRILQEYLEYPSCIEFQEQLAKRVNGDEHLSPLKIRDTLLSELMALHFYHAHLLRSILSCVASATYLTIPAFIMPLLLGDWSYEAAENSKLQEKLKSVKSEGKSIRDILKQSQQIQFIGLPNPFVIPLGENTGVEQCETQRKMLIHAYHKAVEAMDFPGDFSGPSRRIGVHSALELVDPDCNAEWWLRFLESAISNGRPSSLFITVGSPKTPLQMGPPNLGLRPTREYFTRPAHLHLCEELPKLSLSGITRLDLNLLTICPVFFTNARKYLPSISGVWNVTSAPQLCSHWVETNPALTSSDGQIAEDLAVIEQIMHEARSLGENLDISVCLSFYTARLPVGTWKSLTLHPKQDRVIYTSTPVHPHRSPMLGFSAEFAMETFLSSVRTLYPRRREERFGLFNLLDEIAGADVGRIRDGIPAYLASG
ncbi:uncharacterized protein BJX67DRAFT_361418 [Aspergillus lucknowensis]|uniref:Uncharacterized protein n=1 Tax=Aspergillus lucknowensis TaxID=176173 RepID=A0ABR4LIF5_9EURO